MNRILSLFALPVFLLAIGCTPAVKHGEEDLTAFRQNVKDSKAAVRTKPRIPDSSELKASILTPESAANADQTAELLKEIEKRIEKPNILYEDIERGWYYGGQDEKKLGTPKSWVWVQEGRKSRWASPNAIEKTVIRDASELCRSTAGTYVVSCLESETPDCEYIPANVCQCLDGARWHVEQGCILEDEKGDYISVSEQELNRGWYIGLPNQKKLGTPFNWVWVDAGTNSRWQNPNPLN